MSTYTTYTQDDAPEGARPTLANVKSSMGFIPNIFAKMAESPETLKGYLALQNELNTTSLDNTERQIVMMGVSWHNNCDYCIAAHSTIAQGQKIEASVLESIRNRTPFESAQHEALRTFTETLWSTRGNPTPADLEAFYNAGYTQQTALEIVSYMALKTMSNYANHLMQTPVDSQFSANTWEQKTANA